MYTNSKHKRTFITIPKNNQIIQNKILIQKASCKLNFSNLSLFLAFSLLLLNLKLQQFQTHL